MNTRSRFVIFAVTVTGIALGAGRASAGSIPFDAAGGVVARSRRRMSWSRPRSFSARST